MKMDNFFSQIDVTIDRYDVNLFSREIDIINIEIVLM